MFKNHFNIKRFYKALKFDLKLNTKKYISFVVSLLVGLLLFDLFFIMQNNYKFTENNYQTLFYLAFIISIIIVVGTSFPLLKDKKSTINYLMLPASVFEKFLIQFVIRVLGFMILFVPVFWLNFKLADGIYNLFEWKRHVKIDSFGLFTPFRFKDDIGDYFILFIICSLLSLASFLFAGVAYFKKKVLPKTVISFALFVLFLFVLFIIGTLIFYPEKFHLTNVPVFVNVYKIAEHLYNAQLFVYVIGSVSSLFLLPLAYFKLKEKEI